MGRCGKHRASACCRPAFWRRGAIATAILFAILSNSAHADFQTNSDAPPTDPTIARRFAHRHCVAPNCIDSASVERLVQGEKFNVIAEDYKDDNGHRYIRILKPSRTSELTDKSVLVGKNNEWANLQNFNMVLKFFERHGVEFEAFRVDNLGIIAISRFERYSYNRPNCRLDIRDTPNCDSSSFFDQRRCFTARKWGLIYSPLSPLHVLPAAFRENSNLKSHLPSGYSDSFSRTQVSIYVWEYEMCPSERLYLEYGRHAVSDHLSQIGIEIKVLNQ
jgi:hypothetical protein